MIHHAHQILSNSVLVIIGLLFGVAIIGKFTLEVAVEVACSRILFASITLSSFSSKRFLNYASSQHGTNQYWFIINKKVQHFVLGQLARLVMETIF